MVVSFVWVNPSRPNHSGKSAVNILKIFNIYLGVAAACQKNGPNFGFSEWNRYICIRRERQ